MPKYGIPIRRKNMKKLLSTLLVATLVLSLAACGDKKTNEDKTNNAANEAVATTAPTSTPTPVPQASEEDKLPEGVMDYAAYAAAALDSEVTVAPYFQAAQSWWEKDGQGLATIYAQDENGGYFLYECKCTKDVYDQLKPGTRILVKGYKSEWAGEVEITECTLEILDSKNSFAAKATDVTDIYGTDSLNEKINRLVAVNGLTVSAPANYKWNGSGTRGDDLYLNVMLGSAEYTMVVESYLCGKDTDTYKAVEALKAGDIIDVEGFLYWYNGAQPHITKVTVTGSALTLPADGTDYATYAAAALETEVVIYPYFQAAQSWVEENGVGVASVYAQDFNGGYFLYECKCSKEVFDQLKPGTQIRVKGFKSEWAGEVELTDCELEIFDGKSTFVAKPTDVTAIYGTDALAAKINQLISVKGATVESAALYKWDGSGTRGDDLYLNVNLNGSKYTMVVESYLCGKDTDTYKAVEALKAGDKIDIEGFLYWYNGAQPHITKVMK